MIDSGRPSNRSLTVAPRKATERIDPALRNYLDQLVPVPGGVEARRAAMIDALRSREEIPGLPNDVETQDACVEGSIPVRFYTPARQSAAMILVYLHGGGWVAGSIETHDPFCRLLSAAAGVRIASVEYRLAPEHPYPAALEDSLKALRWASGLGDVALGGDSAGANLAAVAAGKVDYLKALLLLYPVTDHPSGGHPSYTENAAGYGLSADLMRWMWRRYAPDVSPDNPEISPLRAKNLPALPETFIATAEYDVLRDEGLAYARKLESAGVSVTHLHAPDMHHNFPVHPGTVARFPQSQSALDEIASWLRSIPAKTKSAT